MKGIGRRGVLALATAGVLLVGAGSAVAATQAGGPPKSPPKQGQQAGKGGGVMAGGVVMNAAAEYLGLTRTELATARHEGKSLAQIAVDEGKTVAGLEGALVAAFKTNLDKAVAAGRITEAQAATALANFEKNVHTVVTRTTTGPPEGKGRGAGKGAGKGMGNGPCRATG